MQIKFQRRLPAERGPLAKRFPQDPHADGGVTSGDSNIPSPFTFTVTVITPPTSSSLVTTPPFTSLSDSLSSTLPPTSILTSTPTTLPPSPTVYSTSSSSPSSSERTTISALAPTPSVSVTTSSGSDNDTASATSGPALPTGAIIGIVIGVVLIFLAGIVVAVRKRSLSRRLRLRGWATKRGPSPSFLWIEPGEESNFVRSGQGPSTIGSFGTLGTQARTFANPSVARGPPLPPLPSHEHRGYTSVPPTPLTVPPAHANQLTEIAIVISTFIPTLPDELPISNRETIRILSMYDDGWAHCSNARGEAGMVPLECLARRGVVPVARGVGRSRVSSLAPSPSPGRF